MRKLASIQKIKSLEPIEGADAIEKATVLGWHLVVKKNEFNVGDLCVYIEIDSLLPDKPEFEFLKQRGLRIKTIRLRKQVSQGICFPLSILPDDFEVIEDKDCTEALGIIKYEPPVPAHLAGIAKGRFPGFIPKTDETRVQVLQSLLDKYAGEKCYVTEKLDGSSVTYYYRNGEFGVCSRNLELIEDAENSYWKFAYANDLENKLKSLNGNFALQGEIVGEGIQKNILKLHGQTVYFFNMFDIDKYEYIPFEKFKNILAGFDLKMVPVINDNYILTNNIEKIVADSTVKSLINPLAWAEGIVIRPFDENLDSKVSKEEDLNSRLSFKAINPEFLLKYGE
ncbi:MAG: RNA ligase (ATP) [Bacteroidota bacterium]